MPRKRNAILDPVLDYIFLRRYPFSYRISKYKHIFSRRIRLRVLWFSLDICMYIIVITISIFYIERKWKILFLFRFRRNFDKYSLSALLYSLTYMWNLNFLSTVFQFVVYIRIYWTITLKFRAKSKRTSVLYTFLDFLFYIKCKKKFGNLVRHFLSPLSAELNAAVYLLPERSRILNISFPLVGIEPTTCHVYSRMLVPLRHDWPL